MQLGGECCALLAATSGKALAGLSHRAMYTPVTEASAGIRWLTEQLLVSRWEARQMTRHAPETITPQAAGAFGEKAVEAELLRCNWIPANVNATVKNAAKFDIYAVKGNRSVQIQVKTCRPNMRQFVCGGFRPGEPVTTKDVGATNFTIVVRMGNHRQDDQFYVLPTAVALKEIGKRQSAQKGRKDIGMWRLSFAPRKDHKEEAGRDIARKWGEYLGRWDKLDG